MIGTYYTWHFSFWGRYAFIWSSNHSHQSQSQTDQFQSVLVSSLRYTFSSRCTKLKFVIVTPSACISVLHFNDINLDPLLRTNIEYFTCKFYWPWWPTKQSASQRMAAMQEQHSNQLQYWTLTFSIVLMACRCKYVPFLRTQQPHLLFQMKSMNCPRKLLMWRLHLNPINLLFCGSCSYCLKSITVTKRNLLSLKTASDDIKRYLSNRRSYVHRSR